MKSKWLWGLGIGLVLVVLLILPFIWRLLIPNGGYGMMGNSYGGHMPMMNGGYGVVGMAMLFMWLLPLSLLALVGLGIAWLVKALIVPNKQQVQRAKESGSPETPEILYNGKEA
jgi:Na+-transporting methylmalonyl-CoA/oxaloacetate decarboxylase gamma subunit